MLNGRVKLHSLIAIQKPWIGVACVDWDNPQLVAAKFYPDDIPADWYLTYYANYIMACALSPDKWLNASADELVDWCEQTQDNFWFYLFCDSVDQFEQAQQCALKFPSKFAGILLSESSNAHLNHDLTLLRMGIEVFNYDYAQLRAAKPALIEWLESEGAQTHGLVLMSAACAHQVKEVQTLLELLGTSS